MNVAGLPTAFVIQLRTGWKATLAWIVGLGATMVATTLSISDLYPTQAKIDGYAQAVASGSALEAINGRVYGLDSLGGVIANEFGFIASFALPLMGISLIARATRGAEESGRLEMLLAGRIGRTAPLLSAMLVAAAALVVTVAALTAGLAAAGVDGAGSILYAASLGALGLVFAGLAALCAQLVEHARGVYAMSLGALVVAYLCRGAGAVLDNPLTWASPLGWAEEARPFGDARWWPVLLSAGVAVLLMVAAAGLAGTRDLGSAPLRRGAAAPRASALLRSRFGFAVRLQRGAVLGWSLGAAVVATSFGALADAATEALASNESLQDVIGGAGADGFSATMALLLAILCGGYAVQAVATLQAEEAAGRLEATLAGPVSRGGWLARQVVVVVAGICVVTAVGALALGVTTAWSTGDADQIGRLVTAVASYLPALLVLAAVGLALFATVPRLFVLAWVVFAFTATTAFLGDILSLPQWLMNLAPTEHVGFPPVDSADPVPLTVLTGVAAVLSGLALVTFRRRDVPRA